MSASFVVADAVVDLQASKLLRPGVCLSLTQRECALLDAARAGAVTPEAMSVTAHALKQVVYRLRRKLAPASLLSTDGGYRLVARPEDRSVVGRASAWEAVDHWLNTAGAAVIQGPAGAGKTTLARAVAGHLEQFVEVVWIDAQRAQTVEDLVRALGAAGNLGSRAQLEARIAEGAPALFVIDNVEQVPELERLSELREMNSAHRWLFTSRRGVPGVEGSVTLGVLDRKAALELLRRRDIGEQAERLLERFDALPLILELVAGKCRSLGLGRVLEAPTLEVLEDKGRTRHRSVNALLTELWETLPGRLRSVMAALSLCCGVFDEDDARELAGATGPELAELLEVSALEARGGTTRMLEVVRQFVHTAVASPPVEAHAAWAVQKGCRLESLLEGPDGRDALTGLARLDEDLRAVAEGGDPALAVCAAWCLMRVANYSERSPPSIETAERLLAWEDARYGRHLRLELVRWYRSQHRAEHARRVLAPLLHGVRDFETQLAHGDVSQLDRTPEEVAVALQEAVDLAQTDTQRARALLVLANVHTMNGALEDSVAAAREVLTLDVSGRHHLDAMLRLGLGLARTPRHPEAVDALREAYHLTESREESPWSRVSAGGNLAVVLYIDGRRAEAWTIAMEVEDLAKRTGFVGWSVQLTLLRTALLVDRGELRRAENLLPAPFHNRMVRHARLGVLASLRMAQGRIDEAAAALIEARELASTPRHAMALVHTQLRLAFVLALTGEPEEASALLDQAEAEMHAMPVPSNHLLAELARLALRLQSEPARTASRAFRVAQGFRTPRTHPDVYLTAGWLQRAADPWLGEDFVMPGTEPQLPQETQPDEIGRVIELGGRTVDLDARKVTGARSARLTPTEVRLVEALLGARGEPVSRDTLLAEVWGYSSKVKTRTLDQTVYRLRRKLEADPAEPAHLLSCYGRGYQLR